MAELKSVPVDPNWTAQELYDKAVGRYRRLEDKLDPRNVFIIAEMEKEIMRYRKKIEQLEKQLEKAPKKGADRVENKISIDIDCPACGCPLHIMQTVRKGIK